MSIHWHALWIGESFNPRVVKTATNASGAYAIREKDSHVVRYVGESSRGVLWKTLLRHFQAPDSFAKVRESGIFTGDPRKYEVALHVTSKGPRPRAPADGKDPSKRLRTLRAKGKRFRTDADQAASEAQAAWIARLKPTKNKDDGKANDEELAAFFRDQQAAAASGRPFEFNPSPRKVAPPGKLEAPVRGLVVLGVLTELVYTAQPPTLLLMRWSLRKGPILAYDGAGRLFIVYRGAPERPSTPAELREYARTHWGAAGVVAPGKALGGGYAAPPLRVLGEAVSVTYTTKKGPGSRAKLADWVHPFGEGSRQKLVLPLLVAHDCAKGKCGPRCAARGSLGLYGGSYRVTERGIVG